MIKATHHIILYPFFKLYTRWQLLRNFKVVRIGNSDSYDSSVLLISNHISWWDGFWAADFNMEVTRKRFFFMMEEKQLLEHKFFSRIGGFSIKKRDRDAIESLEYTAQLLSNKNNLVLIFPQGKIESIYNQDIEFESGVDRIIKSCNEDTKVVFLVNLVDYHSNKKATLYQYYSTFNKDKELYHSYNEFFNRCIEEQVKLKN